MIRVIIGRAPECIHEDGQTWDTWETVSARVELRAAIEAWNASEESTNYPPIQVYRDTENFLNDMVAWMDFATEEEAVMFKLSHPSI